MPREKRRSIAERLVRAEPERFQGQELASLLLDEARGCLPGYPREAHSFARLAGAVLQYAPVTAYAGQLYALAHQLYALAHQGNAHRVAGDLHTAEALLEAARLVFDLAGDADPLAAAAGRRGAGAVSLAYAYDGFLLTSTAWSGPVAGSVERTYDADFRLAEERVNGGAAVTFDQDGDGLLTRAGELNLTRHPDHGLLTGTALGAVTTSRTVNAFGEPVGESAAFAGTPLLETAYTRDDLGRITTKTETRA